MKRLWSLAALMMLLVLTGCGTQQHQIIAPVAVNGSINLSKWNFGTEGPVPLSGTWAFFWNKLYTPGDFRKTHPKPVYTRVPDIWNHYRISGHPLPGMGYATYRLHVIVKDPEQTVAIHVPYASTAYKMWINGTLVATNGKVGVDRNSSVPQYLNQIVSFHGNADIVIQVSNFQHRRGGLFQPVMIGTTGQIVREMTVDESKQMFIFGGLLSVGIYYLILFLFRRRALYHLYFALICVSLAVHTVCEGEVLITQFLPHFSWELQLKIEYITADVAKILLFPLFFNSLFPKLLHKQILRITTSLSLIFMLTALSTPASFYTKYYGFGTVADILIMMYLWLMLLKARVQKREGALVVFSFFTVFIITVFNDILFSMDLIQTGDYLEWGLDFFIFGQAVLLARKFSKSFVLVENLSEDLKRLNQTLEEKIQNRTQKLRSSNEILKQTNHELTKRNQQIREYEQSRKQLLTTISHELRTPITLIQGYLEALIYDIIKDSDKRKQHLVQIHGKTIQLNQLIEDLFELSRLDVRQASFQMKMVPVLAWVKDVLNRFSKDIEQNELRSFTRYDSPLNTNTCYLFIDEARMNQVISNLVFNAVKYSRLHGTIHLTVDHIEVSQPPDETTTGLDAPNISPTPSTFQLRFCVSDEGPGIPEDDVPFIFDRFYKSKKSVQSGVGLGLAISKAIVNHHGGQIWVESIEQKGSSFYFTLPLFQLSQLEP